MLLGLFSKSLSIFFSCPPSIVAFLSSRLSICDFTIFSEDILALVNTEESRSVFQ
nr:MAG TPA: hypothetical protein [Herelleviridae sp.]